MLGYFPADIICSEELTALPERKAKSGLLLLLSSKYFFRNTSSFENGGIYHLDIPQF